MIKKLGILGLLLGLSCGEPPEITRNKNPFPNPGSAGIKDRLATATWSWEGVPLGTEDDVEDQTEAQKIFSGVRIDFHYNPIDGMSGRFRYRNGDGRNFRGLWDFDRAHDILSMVFEDDWGSPILTRPKTAVFDVHEITEKKLEMRFTEFSQSKNAILIFIHRN